MIFMIITCNIIFKVYFFREIEDLSKNNELSQQINSEKIN